MRSFFFLSIFIFLIICVSPAQVSILEKTVTVKQYNTTIDKILAEIRIKYGVKFSYINNNLPLEKKVRIVLINQPLSKVLEEVFISSDIVFQEINGQVILKKSTSKGGGQNKTALSFERKISPEEIKSINPRPIGVDAAQESLREKIYNFSRPNEDSLKRVTMTDSVVQGVEPVSPSGVEDIKVNNFFQASLIPSLSTNRDNREVGVNVISVNILA